MRLTVLALLFEKGNSGRLESLQSNEWKELARMRDEVQMTKDGLEFLGDITTF